MRCTSCILRTKKVDFVVTENDKPWLMIEVKASKHTGLNPHLTGFKEA